MIRDTNKARRVPAAVALAILFVACSKGAPDSSQPEPPAEEGGLEVAPAIGFEVGAPRGGPIPSTIQTYALSNSSSTRLDWSVNSTAAWLRTLPAAGSLGPGQVVQLEVDVDPSIAGLLGDGLHSGTLTIRDESAGEDTALLPLTLWIGVVVENEAWMRVAGEKFFPIYVWDQPPTQESVDYVESLGINTFMIHGFTPAEAYNRDLLDMLEAKGMYGVLFFDAGVIDHPALFAWITRDEPFLAGTPPAEVQGRYDSIKAADPDALVITNFSSRFYNDSNFGTAANRAVFQQYFAIPDLISFDHYPISGWGRPDWLYMTGSMVEFLHDVYLTPGPKPVWEFIEASDFGLSFVTPLGGPGPEELRFEVWDAIIEGATGIGYFTITLEPFTWSNVKPAVETEMRRTNGQVRALTEVLLSDPPPLGMTVAVSGGGPVDFTLRQHGASVYLFAANADMSSRAISVTFSFDGPPSSITVYDEARSIAPIGSSFVDDFDALEVHIYELLF